MNDPIADMLTRIRNGLLARKKEVVLPYSNIKFKIAGILSREGYIGKVEKIDINKFSEIKIELRYKGKEPVIKSIRRVSKPGQRVYSRFETLPVVLNNLGISIISTSKGLMTNNEAKKQRMGGEILCEIY